MSVKKTHKKSNQKGFTLIEILMALTLIAILSGIAVTQYQDFSTEAKNGAVKSDLSMLRKAISTHYGQMRLRCGTSGTAWPPLATINANDITNTGDCSTAEVPAPDRPFLASSIPVNPWGFTSSATVTACVGSSCTTQSDQCASAGTDRTNTAVDIGWCYDVSTGKIWANSSNNNGAGAGSGNEHTY